MSLSSKIFGHRGASGHAPENTLSAIAKAAALGCKWVEVDLKLSSDGVIVLFHDDDFSRTANAERTCAETPLYMIKALDVGRWFSDEFIGETVPTVSEFLSLLTALGMGVNLELKPDKGFEEETGKKIAEYVRDNWPSQLPSPIISSFDRDALAASHEVLPRVEHAILWEDIPSNWQDEVESLKADAIHVDADKLTETQCKAFIDSGSPVRCYTVNDKERAAELIGWGVEGIFTDYPDRMKGLK
ncbi:glycerophosphodiester phosphodiesterase family protein [Curvivirga aplysinae]|uniref:glycerophosphodiester phosphodiesterase family protein n=1 Tax=Curvivirga aplysinae TaxID=2529852 RepID=UPI0012BC78F5|nr:glycerophosphodiester phosphodiesterase family protein [Curvivirga aplysinae]MTI11104.1 glycerophosphoryl diester phosphodiesterase [Curvivirga aplysinae]